MNIYLTYGSLFAVYIEVNSNFGRQPLFSQRRHKGETVIQMPYLEAIFTPRYKLNISPVNDEVEHNYETGHTKFIDNPSGVSEN